LEYSRGGFQVSPDNQWVSNYKKGVDRRGKKDWHYKEEAIQYFADLIINTPFKSNCILLAGPPSKQPNSPIFDSRNQDVLKSVHNAIGVPISFALSALQDIEPVHYQAGYRNPKQLRDLYNFTPLTKIPEIIYIVDDVITSGSHFVVWRNLIHDYHPKVEVRGIYLARTVNELL
jgi:hypothetical protein